MEEILSKYSNVLNAANYEVIRTAKLGWIIIRTDYQLYSNPIIQISTPVELEKYILSQMHFN